jgi:hypothetical protein
VLLARGNPLMHGGSSFSRSFKSIAISAYSYIGISEKYLTLIRQKNVSDIQAEEY